MKTFNPILFITKGNVKLDLKCLIFKKTLEMAQVSP